MSVRWISIFLAAAGLLCAQPAITDLQPRGAQKGRPFKLTIVGKGFGEETKVWSTLPATFTPLTPELGGAMSEGKYATFLVEPTAEIPVGVYPIRVLTPEGISNIQLFSVGGFPEYAEDESRPGALPNSNDTIETAQALPSAPLVVNGTLRGPERDMFRLSAKAGERLVIEVEARRCGSAIDPVLEILDGSGKAIAHSEDAAMLGLDSRADVTFPQAGYYYVVVHDARFSNQPANFYRLKIGSYPYPNEIYPLGGRRGEVVQTSLGAQKIPVDLRNVDAKAKQIMVNLPDSPVLPIPFAVGDD
ncbi:MAG TPA: PPC domain-containing protein, partial [Rhizomicrobium sp.]